MAELTPVIYEHGFYWKREDFYKFLDLNGSKARFILDTLYRKKDIIKEQYNNTIIVKNKLNSHSLYTQTRITEYLNMNLVNIHEIDSYTGTKELQFYKNIQRNNKLLVFSQNYTTGFRFNQKSTDIDKYSYTAIINQVKNIPKDIDYFIISCGSSQTLYGVLWGFIKYGNIPKHIFAIGNKFPNPMIDLALLGLNCKFTWFDLRQFNNTVLQAPIDLDTQHELRAWSFLITKLYTIIKGKKNLFWVTANYNFLRKLIQNTK